MPVTLRIIDETVHHYVFTNPWTWEEWIETSAEGKAVAHKLQEDPDFPGVVVIGDFSDATRFPKRTLVKYPQIIQIASDVKVTRLIGIGSSRYGRMLGNIFGSLWGHIDYYATREEAFASIGMEAPSDE